MIIFMLIISLLPVAVTDFDYVNQFGHRCLYTISSEPDLFFYAQFE
jgi:hypothetical protein